MFKFLKASLFTMIMAFFASFYVSYFLTVNYQIFSIHRKLIETKVAASINFGVITFIVFALMPILILKMSANSEIPLLVKTYRARTFISYIIISYTISLFASKIIYNAIAKDVMSWQTDLIFSAKGRVMFVEIFSLGVPVVLFLWLSKKIMDFLNREDSEDDTFQYN